MHHIPRMGGVVREGELTLVRRAVGRSSPKRLHTLHSASLGISKQGRSQGRRRMPLKCWGLDGVREAGWPNPFPSEYHNQMECRERLD